VIGRTREHLRALVVDDRENARRFLRTLLTAIGVQEVVEAGNGVEGIAALSTAPADLVVTDWCMAPMHGPDFVRYLRTHPQSPNPYVPIIMLTGHACPDLIAEARDCGVNEFLAKPVSAKSLLACVTAVIENPRPFVKTSTYFGPDRRRRQVRFRGADRRNPHLMPGRPNDETAEGFSGPSLKEVIHSI